MDSGKRSQHVDKMGESFETGKCNCEDLPEVTAMYESFSPKPASQGLPPAEKDTRSAWVQKLFQTAENFAVWKSGMVVGHCALVSDMRLLDAEYLIFVLTPQQNRGIGTVLTKTAIDHALQIGLKNLWLTVEAYNFRAIRMYKNAGFQFVDECDRERTMLKSL